MVWNVLFQVGAALLVEAAAGYGAAAIVNSLSRSFANLWEEFVDSVRDVWGYVTDATESLLASVAQWVDQSWNQIGNYLSREIGYRSEWLVAVFMEEREVFVEFVDPTSHYGESVVAPIGFLESGTSVQLPTRQNPMVRKLILRAVAK